MTYVNDPNRRGDMPLETSYAGWMVGGAVALAVILAIFFMTSGPTNNNSTASNTTSPTTTSRPAPSTTGSGAIDAPANPPAPLPNAPAR